MQSTKKPRIQEALLLCATFLSGAAAYFFGFLFLKLYWPYRNLFNEEGRYFDEKSPVVYHQQSGFFIVPTFVFLFLVLIFGFIWRARRRQTEGVKGRP